MEVAAVADPGADAQLSASKPTPEILDLGDVDLNSVLDDLDTTCSPFSDGQLKNLSSCCTGSISSDNPYYFWYVKNRADAIKKSTRLAQGDHDNNSTCGMINIRYSTKINMCENPSDMWHGLKMSDGTPVVIRASRRNRFNSAPARGGGDGASRRRVLKGGRTGSFGPMATAAAYGEAGVAAMFQKSAAVGTGGVASGSSGPPGLVTTSFKGPIDYSGGFLAIGHYLNRQRKGVARRLARRIVKSGVVKAVVSASASIATSTSSVRNVVDASADGV